MYKEKRVLFLKVLTPLHAGSGTDLRAVDLPIQREVHTGFPKIEASTLKGCLRNSFEKDLNKDVLDAIFGIKGEGELSAAALAITDARLLFFPVRSAKGVYALITCPMVLERFKKDMELAGVKEEFDVSSTDAPALASESSILKMKTNGSKQTILLDEYWYDINISPSFKEICKKMDKSIGGTGSITKRAVLLSDDDFKYFVMHSTSIVTRIKVGTDGVAENQALFTEEYLPEESILYSLVMMSDSKLKSYPADDKKLIEDFSKNRFSKNSPGIFQIGADETLGKGFVEAYLKGGDKNE